MVVNNEGAAQPAGQTRFALRPLVPGTLHGLKLGSVQVAAQRWKSLDEAVIESH